MLAQAFNYVGTGGVCLLMCYVLSTGIVAKRDNLSATIGRLIVLSILFMIGLRT